MQGTHKYKTGPQANKIGVRLNTLRKFKRVAKANRWSLVDAADVVVDAFLGVNSGKIDRVPDRRRGDPTVTPASTEP